MPFADRSFAAACALVSVTSLAALASCGADPDGSPDFNDVPQFPSGGGGGVIQGLNPSQGGQGTSGSGGATSQNPSLGGRSSEGVGGNVTAPPAAGSSGSGPQNQGGSQNGGGGSGGDSGSGGVGRVGAELCPAGPFGSPLPSNPQIEPLVSVGANDFFVWEGVVWTGEELYFSEIGNGNVSQISRFTPGGAYERGVFPNAGSNGLALDGNGNLLLAAHDVGGISSVDLGSGQLTRGSQTLNGSAFNSPNDLVLRSDGNLYFTDPNFQSPGGRIGATRAYRIDPAGAVSIVEDELSNPNGITLSPDGRSLYISGAGIVRQFSLDPAGTPAFVRDFPTRLGTPDGMAIDCAGNVYAVDNSAMAIRVFSPDGELLGSIGPGGFEMGVTNAAFGGPNRTTLFVTTFSQGQNGGLYSVELNVPGLPY